MSFEATVRLKCDRCGRVLAEKTVLASPDEIKSVRWGMEHGAKGTGIMVDERVSAQGSTSLSEMRRSTLSHVRGQ
jgi:hypothetical protein